MAHYDDVVLPEEVERGVTGGPRFLTVVAELPSGFRQSLSYWPQVRGEWDIAYGIAKLEDAVAAFQINSVSDIFYVLEGRAHSGLFKDWADYQTPYDYPNLIGGAAFQSIGTGDGIETDFQLTKTYIVGSRTYIRTIQKPVSATLVVRKGVTPQNDPADYTITALGLVQFVVAPAGAVDVNFQSDYSVPFAFQDDKFEITMATFEAGQIPSTMIEQVLL